MSPWSAERIRIGLAPDRVDLARLGFGPRRKAIRQHSVACAATAGEAPWQAALDALDAALAEFASRGGSVTVVLSNHWVRYAVLPWQPEVTSAAEVEQLARLHFDRSFGPAAAGWTIRNCDTGYGAAHVACAVDTALIAELRARLAAHGLRLASLQPLLMAGYNEVRRSLTGNTALAVVEPGRVCLGLLDQDRWIDIASRRAGADPALAIEQELATHGSAAPPRLDVLLVGEDTPWAERAGLPTRLLGRPDPGSRRSLAMCGAG